MTPPPSQPLPAGVARLEGPLRDALEEGIAHQRARRLRDAEAAYRRALADHPEQPDALNLLGTLLVRLNGLPEGLRHVRRAVELRPDDATIRSNLAGILIQLGRFAEAVEELEAARVAAPESREVRLNYARALRGLGRGEEAIEQYRQLLAAEPGSQPALIGLGKAHAERGDRASAADAFRQAIAVWPDDPAGHIELAAVTSFAADNGEAARMAALAANAKLGTLDRARLFHAAGKVCDDLGRPDEAFAHYRAAKALDRIVYDPAARSTAIDRLIDTFGPALIEAKGGYGDPSERPLFIVGMPRAGINLAERVLASHPAIASAGDLMAITRLALRLPGAAKSPGHYPEAARDLTPEAARALSGRYLAALDRVSSTAARVIDKMPHNFEHLGLIALLFPNARIVHCRRDPLDVCAACYAEHFSDAHGYNRDLGHLAHYYRAYERLMAHWKNVLPLAIFDLSFEALVTEPERTSRALVDFTGLPWDERCLQPLAAEAVNGRASRRSTLQSAIGRWRRYEPHLGPLREALGR